MPKNPYKQVAGLRDHRKFIFFINQGHFRAAKNARWELRYRPAKTTTATGLESIDQHQYVDHDEQSGLFTFRQVPTPLTIAFTDRVLEQVHSQT